MPAYMSQFFSGALDPTWPHVVLISGTILGGALVGLGVILEAPKLLSVATLSVFVGILIEAACTLLLFGFDEGISTAQQRTIEQLLAKRRLSFEQKERIAAAIGHFQPTKFVLVTVPEAEPWDFAMDIAATLRSHGWDWLPCPPSSSLGFVKPMDDRPTACTSILDHIEFNASPQQEKLARALGAAIEDKSIVGMDDVRYVIGSNHPTMVIMVGTKR